MCGWVLCASGAVHAVCRQSCSRSVVGEECASCWLSLPFGLVCPCGMLAPPPAPSLQTCRDVCWFVVVCPGGRAVSWANLRLELGCKHSVCSSLCTAGCVRVAPYVSRPLFILIHHAPPFSGGRGELCLCFHPPGPYTPSLCAPPPHTHF